MTDQPATTSDRVHVLYLALEAPREGQASYAHIHEIIAGLRHRGCTVELFAPSYSQRWERPGLALRLVEYLRLQWRLVRAYRAGQTVYVRSHFLAFPTSLWARLRGVPIVHEINGPFEDVSIAYRWATPLAGVIGWIWRRQYAWASRLIVVTPQLADWVVLQVGARPVEVVPNGANTELFHPGAERAGDLPARYAVFFGGLARWQGIPTLLAARRSPEWPADVALVVVGDGPERAAVEAAAAQDPGIVYLGRRPYRALPSVVAGSLCGLVPKNNLGDRTGTGLFPLKVFETMACGVPVIVSDFPGQADLVREHDCGIAVPAEDGDALARAVARIAGDPGAARAMGERGRAAVVAGHSWDARAGQTLALLGALRDTAAGR